MADGCGTDEATQGQTDPLLAETAIIPPTEPMGLSKACPGKKLGVGLGLLADAVLGKRPVAVTYRLPWAVGAPVVGRRTSAFTKKKKNESVLQLCSACTAYRDQLHHCHNQEPTGRSRYQAKALDLLKPRVLERLTTLTERALEAASWQGQRHTAAREGEEAQERRQPTQATLLPGGGPAPREEARQTTQTCSSDGESRLHLIRRSQLVTGQRVAVVPCDVGGPADLYKCFIVPEEDALCDFGGCAAACGDGGLQTELRKENSACRTGREEHHKDAQNYTTAQHRCVILYIREGEKKKMRSMWKRGWK